MAALEHREWFAYNLYKFLWKVGHCKYLFFSYSKKTTFNWQPFSKERNIKKQTKKNNITFFSPHHIWRASGLYRLSGKITVTLLSLGPISFLQISFRALVAAGMVMPCRPQPFPCMFPHTWHFMFSDAMCPSAGPGSVVALGYLMSLFRMVCQSALTLHCFVKWGRTETPRIPLSLTVIKSKIIPPLFIARFEVTWKNVAFGNSQQSLR